MSTHSVSHKQPDPPGPIAGQDQTLILFSACFRGDLDRFVLLRDSIRRFEPCPLRHIVVVPAKDMLLFRKRLGGDAEVELVAEDDLIPTYFYPTTWYRAVRRLIPSQSWRFSAHAGRPGWIVQQIVKLSLPSLVAQGPVAVFDSDLFVVRPFTLQEFGVGSEKRLLLRDEPPTESGRHRDYMSGARKIVGLSQGPTEHHYIANPAIWYPDWVSAAQRRIEEVHAKPWQRVLFEAGTISEYCIYGVFVEEVLHPAALEINLEGFHRGVWSMDDFRNLLRGDFLDGGIEGSRPLTIVVQSNLGMPVAEYLAIAERYMNSWRGA